MTPWLSIKQKLSQLVTMTKSRAQASKSVAPASFEIIAV